jgi:hypothetical protein
MIESVDTTTMVSRSVGSGVAMVKVESGPESGSALGADGPVPRVDRPGVDGPMPGADRPTPGADGSGM